MKRAGDLWPKLVSFENLHHAAHRALRGKRSRPEACDFFSDLESNLFALQRELLDRRHLSGEYRTFWITDPKPRLISAAPFRDRVVHHALVQVIEPVFERRFIHHSYACRTGKGNHRALARFVEWSRASRFVLKMDIRKFFPSVDHTILRSMIRRAVKDEKVLWLCDTIIDGSNEQERVYQWYPGDDLLTPAERRKGIPIGNLTSQFFGNVYLDALDHFIKEQLRVKRCLRYVDDLALFSDDKAELRAWRAAVAECLIGLRLRLNEGKSRIRQIKEGIEFMGFVVLPDRLRLSSRNIRKMRRRMKRLRCDYARGHRELIDIQRSLQAWNAHAAHGNTWRLRADVFSCNPFRGALGSDCVSQMHGA